MKDERMGGEGGKGGGGGAYVQKGDQDEGRVVREVDQDGVELTRVADATSHGLSAVRRQAVYTQRPPYVALVDVADPGRWE